ncbi:---NA--- [Paramuricea clavata]|uniref:---NA n=1 Tax=Paramuricea clavata TaxID=317549 RepID=A0A6S7K869_PARCT|nr:---NA--- [Paramuricea clavata]
MSSPLAHSPTLPGDQPSRERFSCGTCTKTFKNMITRHAHLMRYSHELNNVLEISVPFFLNLRKQVIKCPVCPFKAKQAKSPRSFVTHFSRHGNCYNLTIAYTCSVCMEVMTIDEVQDHLELHRSNHLPLTPTTSQPSEQASHDPVPTSPSTDDTLSTSATSSPPSSLPLSTPPPTSPASLDSQTLPDTQNPMSPSAPSPPSFSPPPETNAALIRRFLEACGNTPVPTAPSAPVNPSTPHPAIPPLMANIITTPTPNLPSTRQPSPRTTTQPPVLPRPRAADFFDLPPSIMEDLPEPNQPTTPPPRPQSLPC